MGFVCSRVLQERSRVEVKVKVKVKIKVEVEVEVEAEVKEGRERDPGLNNWWVMFFLTK
ncbi:MAG TPA: hypothetical protein PKM27_12815 [Saprospiraceae bacterium]|nr:hypothetical protein [Saprospiraceae bacterium]